MFTNDVLEVRITTLGPTRKIDNIAGRFSAEYIPAAKIEILSVLTFQLYAGLSTQYDWSSEPGLHGYVKCARGSRLLSQLAIGQAVVVL